VPVTAHAIDIVGLDGDRVTLSVDCSAGFYVRSLAYDLGERLGVGAHLAELRRTRSGDATLDDAVSLHVVERNPDRAAAAIVPLTRMLPGLAPVVLTPEGARRATHGRDLGPGDTEKADAHLFGTAAADRSRDCRSVRLLDGSGQLIGIGEPARTPGLLHPAVVLV
jgi:tRNA U55 pseudouridine synthase TruB